MADFLNNTNDDIDLWRINNQLAKELAPTTAIWILYAIIGITGNSVSIYIYRFRMKEARRKRHFILCLSATDLTTCVLGSGFAIFLDVFPLTFKGDIICKLVWTLNSFLTISSALLLVLIAVYRYRLICVPLGKPFKLVWRRIALIATFLTAFILSIPNLTFYGERIATFPEYNISGTTCGKSHYQQNSELLLFYNCLLFTTFAIGATSLVVLYVFIGKTILALSLNGKRAKNTDSFMEKSISSKSTPFKDASDLTHKNNSEIDDVNTCTLPKSGKKDNKSVTSRLRKHRHTFMFMLITVILLISYTPRLIIMIIESIFPLQFVGISVGQYRTYLFFFRLYLVNNIVNPFIYSIFDLEFRTALRKMLKMEFTRAPRDTT